MLVHVSFGCVRCGAQRKRVQHEDINGGYFHACMWLAVEHLSVTSFMLHSFRIKDRVLGVTRLIQIDIKIAIIIRWCPAKQISLIHLPMNTWDDLIIVITRTRYHVQRDYQKITMRITNNKKTMYMVLSNMSSMPPDYEQHIDVRTSIVFQTFWPQRVVHFEGCEKSRHAFIVNLSQS